MRPAQSISTHLQPAPPSSFQPPPSSLQHPQRYENQNIERNWAIYPNLGRKIQICLFCLKISTHGILEVMILNPDLDFWKSNPKIHFWSNLGRKSQSCPFCLKIDTHGTSKPLTLILALVFGISNPKSIFGQIWAKKSKLSILPENWGCWFLLQH